jgi:hypothetical protein
MITNLLSKLRNAVQSDADLEAQVEKYEKLAHQPQSYLNDYFTRLEQVIYSEEKHLKNLVKDLIESKTKQYIADLQAIKSSQMNRLNSDFMRNFNSDLINETKLEVCSWAPDLLPNKMCEDR